MHPRWVDLGCKFGVQEGYLSQVGLPIYHTYIHTYKHIYMRTHAHTHTHIFSGQDLNFAFLLLNKKLSTVKEGWTHFSRKSFTFVHRKTLVTQVLGDMPHFCQMKQGKSWKMKKNNLLLFFAIKYFWTKQPILRQILCWEKKLLFFVKNIFEQKAHPWTYSMQ